jgi:hypothetical protein
VIPAQKSRDLLDPTFPSLGWSHLVKRPICHSWYLT